MSTWYLDRPEREWGRLLVALAIKPEHITAEHGAAVEWAREWFQLHRGRMPIDN